MRAIRTTVILSALPTLVTGLVLIPVVSFDRGPHPVASHSHQVDLSAYTVSETDPVPDALTSDGKAAPAPAKVVETVVDSPQIATDDFRVAGVTWDESSVKGEVFTYVRTREEGDWTDWYALDDESDDGPDPGTAEAAKARAGTAPLIVGQSDAVQVKVATADGQTPGAVKIDLIDPGSSSADANVDSTPLASAGAAVKKPTIYTRAAWGANERIREKGKPDYGSVHAAVVHHTAGSNSYTKSQVPAIIRAIYAYHVKARHWRDIGYNVLVDKFGRAWEGRYGGITKNVVGAHALNNNSTTFGVSVMGNFDSATPSASVVETISKLIAWKFDLNRVTPTGSWKYTTNKGKKVTLSKIVGHRNVGQTACPGARLYAKLPQVRSRVSAIMKAQGGVPVTVSVKGHDRTALTYTVGQNQVDLDVTVKPHSGSKVPTGPVEVSDLDYGDVLGTGTLKASSTKPQAVATVKLKNALRGGTRHLVASYGGSSSMAWGNSAKFDLKVTKATSSAKATYNRTKMVAGDQTTASVTVSAPGIRPSGTVRVYSGSTAIGSGTLKAASAKDTSTAKVALWRNLGARKHTLVAKYAGTTSIKGSSGSKAYLVVTKGHPRLSIGMARTAHYGEQPVVRVRASAHGLTPSGKVVVRQGSRTVGVGKLHSGVANVWLTRSTSLKRRYVTVSYAGAYDLYAAPHRSGSFHVYKAKPKVKRSLNHHKIRHGQTVKLKFKARATGVRLKGDLVIRDRGHKIKKVRLKKRYNGKITVTLPRRSRGTHKITVRLKSTKYVRAYQSKKMVLRVR